jgi:manganese oxidase
VSCLCEVCRYSFSLGTEAHTAHWHGNTLVWRHTRSDVVDVGPADSEIGDMVPDSAGLWLMHCHVDDHLAAGMIAKYNVTARHG